MRSRFIIIALIISISSFAQNMFIDGTTLFPYGNGTSNKILNEIQITSTWGFGYNLAPIYSNDKIVKYCTTSMNIPGIDSVSIDISFTDSLPTSYITSFYQGGVADPNFSSLNYDNQNRLESILQYAGGDNTASLDDSIVFNYDANGLVSSHDFYDQGQLIDTALFTLDNNGRVIEILSGSGLQKTVNTFDADGNLTLSIIYSFDGVSWTEEQRMTMNWTDITTGLFENDFQVGVFPNPATSFIEINSEISLARVSLYSIDGKHLRSVLGQNRKEFNVSVFDLPKGIVIVKAEDTSGNVHTISIVIK